LVLEVWNFSGAWKLVLGALKCFCKTVTTETCFRRRLWVMKLMRQHDGARASARFNNRNGEDLGRSGLPSIGTVKRRERRAPSAVGMQSACEI
jgi:hypothetical protein